MAKNKQEAPVSSDLKALRNSVREPLHPLEEARMYARLMERKKGSTQRDLAKSIGVSQARISQRLALLAMPKEIVKLMDSSDALTERHARTRLRRSRRSMALYTPAIETSDPATRWISS